MTRSLPTTLSLAFACAICAICAVWPSALAQADASGAGEAVTEIHSCAWVDDGTDRANYFRDLCRALAIAVQGDKDALELAPVEATGIGRALAPGAHLVAVGVPVELRAEPDLRLGPVVLIGDSERWALAHPPGADEAGDTAAWVFHALVQAEAFGVDADALATGLPEATRERFLRYEARLAGQLRLAPDFLRRTIAELGHHGEIWTRHFGGDPGPNRPVELGGRLFAPPVSDR